MQETPAAPKTHPLPNTWVDGLYRKLDRSFNAPATPVVPEPDVRSLVIVSLLCGAIVYAVGFLFAILASFPGTYLATLPVYYGVFGISWVMGCLRWGPHRMPKLLEETRICFKDDEQFLGTTNQFLQAVSSRKGAFWVSGVVFVVGIAGLVLGFRTLPPHIQRRLLPELWYHDYLYFKIPILLLFDAGCSLTIGTGAWFILANTRFLRALSGLAVIPLPGVLIARFRPLSVFYLISALTWFVGVALFGVLFFNRLDAFAITILLVAGAFGFILSLGPQFVFYRFISRAASETAGEFARMFKSDLSGRIDHDHLSAITSMLQATQSSQMWIINLKDLFLLMLAQLLPIAAVGFKEKVDGYIKYLLSR